MWFSTFVSVLAAMTPDAAADGVPMPGKHESPQRSSPSTGVFRLGKGKGRRPESFPEKVSALSAARGWRRPASQFYF